jgi:hypothetical protein
VQEFWTSSENKLTQTFRLEKEEDRRKGSRNCSVRSTKKLFWNWSLYLIINYYLQHLRFKPQSLQQTVTDSVIGLQGFLHFKYSVNFAEAIEPPTSIYILYSKSLHMAQLMINKKRKSNIFHSTAT